MMKKDFCNKIGAKRTFREVRQIIERALVSSFHPLLYALPFDLLKQGLVA